MTSNGPTIGTFIAGAHAFPPEVLDAARLCLADWMGVAIGAAAEPAGRIVRETVAQWRSTGRSSVLFGGTAAAPFAALANGTLAHCLDFDDTYVDAVTHTSAPVWAATLALGEETEATEPEMLAALEKQQALKAPLRGVLHSFAGSTATAEQCLAHGLYISFAGMLTYKKSEELRQTARTIPLDRILVETDCPYLTPEPNRSRRPNEPSFVVHTAKCLAETIGISGKELAEITTENARRLFWRMDT